MELRRQYFIIMKKVSFYLLLGAMLAIFSACSKHDYVDLGLPSGTLWATCNVGADSPEAFGDYFAWGETKPQQAVDENQDTYGWKTYAFGKRRHLTKYCTDSYYGENEMVDNKTTLEICDDAAYINWGGKWRMPTKNEVEELLEACTWTWTTVNGVNGHEVKGPNGNSIFLPAAGAYARSEFKGNGIVGAYWSSSLVEEDTDEATCMAFYGEEYESNSMDRYMGMTVRPVK